MNKKTLLKIQKQAEGWVKEAGKILQKYQKKAVIKKRKSDFLDITTDADLASESYLIKQIRKNFPHHNILSEEQEEKLKHSDFTWVIDPLDGTKEYVRGLPMYNVCLALEYKTTTIMGVVFVPPTNELFSASKNNGAFFNGKRIAVSPEKSLKNSFILTHLPDFKTRGKEATFTWRVLEKLRTEVYRLRSYAAHDLIMLCWLALGAFEGYILTLPSAKWEDTAPGLLIVEEAGGKVTNMQGRKIKNRDLSKGIVASNGKIHEKLLHYLKS